MPWFQIIMALVSFFITKKRTGSTSKAALAAVAGGLAANWVVDNTQFGKEYLGGFNSTIDGWLGLDSGTVDSAGTVKDASGKVVSVPVGTKAVAQPDGSIVYIPTSGQGQTGTSVWDVFKSWGPTGTAAVVGTTAVATDSDLKKWLPIGLAALAAILILK